MALFDGVRRFFRSIVGGAEEPRHRKPKQPPPPPPPPPPRPPPLGGDFFPDAHDENMRSRFNELADEEDITFNDRGEAYRNWRELFEDTGITQTEDDNREIERLFSEFLRAFYLTSEDRDSFPRSEYYSDSGLGSDRIDWERFREIKKT